MEQAGRSQREEEGVHSPTPVALHRLRRLVSAQQQSQRRQQRPDQHQLADQSQQSAGLPEGGGHSAGQGQSNGEQQLGKDRLPTGFRMGQPQLPGPVGQDQSHGHQDLNQQGGAAEHSQPAADHKDELIHGLRKAEGAADGAAGEGVRVSGAIEPWPGREAWEVAPTMAWKLSITRSGDSSP